MRSSNAAVPSSLFFHLENLTQLLATRHHPFVDRAECRKRLGCEPAYLKRWQQAIRRSINLDGLTEKKYATCAVVGSSNSVMHDPRGELINGMEVVIRVNEAPVGPRYARHVGNRTTLRIWGSPGNQGMNVTWGLHPSTVNETAGVLLSCFPSRWAGRCWGELELAVEHDAGARVLPTEQARAAHAPRLSPSVNAMLQDDLRRSSEARNLSYSTGKVPSTGAIAVFVALRTCAAVWIFGFGDCTATARRCAKYFLPHNGLKAYRRQHELNNHDAQMEKTWLIEQVRTRRIVDPEGCFS